MMNSFRSALLAAALLCSPAFAQDAEQPATEPAVIEAEATATVAAEPAAETPAASGPVAAPPAGKAQVVFYRPSSLLGAALSFTIHDGGAPVTKLGLGRYYVHVVEPGAHTFEVKSEATDTLDLEVDPDETYYVKQTMGMGALLYRPNLTPATQADFEALAKKLKPAKPAKQKS